GVILGQTLEAHYREIETYVNEEKQRQYTMLRPGQVLFSDDPSHVLVIAPTRWGKGISCVCTTLLCWSHSAIVYDIKGELFEITSGWRRAFSHILRFDPSGYDSVHFNPLWEIQRNTPNDVSQAQNIAELLCNPNGDDLKPDHWRESAAQILVGAILYVLYSNDEKDKSLHGVYHLLNDPNKPFENVLNQMLTLKHNAVQESARGMLNKAPNERSGVLSTAVRFLALYQDPIVAANTAYSDFSIKDLTAQKHPCTLYLCINPKDAARLKPLTRLVLSLIATTLTSGFHTNKNRLLFLIDEFPSLGRLSFFEQALAFFAGFNVKCMLIAQSFNQLFATYGERNSILDNCKHKAILGVGSPQDAKLVSDFLGTYSVNRKTVSQSGTLGSIIARSRSTSYMETEKKLMTVDELLRLPFEDFILITAGQFPYRGRKLMYYLDPRFKDRVKLPTLANWSDQLQELPKRRLQLPWLSENALVVLKKNRSEEHTSE